MTLTDRLRAEATGEQCTALTPLLNAAANHIESLEQQLAAVRAANERARLELQKLRGCTDDT